jgi:hypothetical protein
VGSSCASWGDCATGLTCALQGPTTGVCGTRVGVGEDCMRAGCDGAEGYCDSTTWLCTRWVPLGADCTNAECVRYGACDSGTLKCVPKSGPGGPCSENKDCVGGALTCGTDGACALPPAALASLCVAPP